MAFISHNYYSRYLLLLPLLLVLAGCNEDLNSAVTPGRGETESGYKDMTDFNLGYVVENSGGSGKYDGMTMGGFVPLSTLEDFQNQRDTTIIGVNGDKLDTIVVKHDKIEYNVLDYNEGKKVYHVDYPEGTYVEAVRLSALKVPSELDGSASDIDVDDILKVSPYGDGNRDFLLTYKGVGDVILRIEVDTRKDGERVTLVKEYPCKVKCTIKFNLRVNKFWEWIIKFGRVRYSCTELPSNLKDVYFKVQDSLTVKARRCYYDYERDGRNILHEDTLLYTFTTNTRYEKLRKGKLRVLRNFSDALKEISELPPYEGSYLITPSYLEKYLAERTDTAAMVAGWRDSLNKYGYYLVRESYHYVASNAHLNFNCIFASEYINYDVEATASPVCQMVDTIRTQVGDKVEIEVVDVDKDGDLDLEDNPKDTIKNVRVENYFTFVFNDFLTQYQRDSLANVVNNELTEFRRDSILNAL